MTTPQEKAKENYRKKTKHVGLEFNIETEGRLLQKLEANEPKATYIKKLILDDIEKDMLTCTWEETAADIKEGIIKRTQAEWGYTLSLYEYENEVILVSGWRELYDGTHFKWQEDARDISPEWMREFTVLGFDPRMNDDVEMPEDDGELLEIIDADALIDGYMAEQGFVVFKYDRKVPVARTS